MFSKYHCLSGLSLLQQDFSLCLKKKYKCSWKEERCQPDVSIQHASKSVLSEGTTKPKQCQAMEVLLHPGFEISHVQELTRPDFTEGNVAWKWDGPLKKKQVENKTQFTLKQLSRNVHFPDISAVSENWDSETWDYKIRFYER